ncbi:MAG: hypothetical protein KatS3mg050_4818 [Litorilinea sp.]|nr:MAG: hypothetical protein KatS3mg050_4818 [Litorilinea sp.]
MNLTRMGVGLAGVGLAAFVLRQAWRTADSVRWLEILARPTVRQAARRVLLERNRNRQHPEQGRFTGADVNQILAETWQRYRVLAAAGSPLGTAEPTPGSRLTVLLACLSLACLQTLLNRGLDRAYAVELCADMAWHICQRWARLPDHGIRLIARTPLQRLRMNVELFLRFPFNPPGYIVERLPDAGDVAFNIRRCPIAEYFQAHGAVDLCTASWCNLDYALAERWGGRLERKGTLAWGDACCDFRFLPEKNRDTPRTASKPRQKFGG